MQELLEPVPEDRELLAAEQAFQRGVHRGERELEVEQSEAERRLLEAVDVAALGLSALLLGEAAVGDVAQVRDDPADRGHVHQVDDGLLHPPPLTRFRADTPLAPTHLAAGERPGEYGLADGQVVGVDHLPADRADQLVRVVAEAGDRRAGVGDDPGGVEDERDIGRALHERAEASLRGGERFTRGDEVAHVTRDDGDGGEPAVGVVHG